MSDLSKVTWLVMPMVTSSPVLSSPKSNLVTPSIQSQWPHLVWGFERRLSQYKEAIRALDQGTRVPTASPVEAGGERGGRLLVLRLDGGSTPHWLASYPGLAWRLVRGCPGLGL